jgi:hypothetical protein
VEEEKGRERKRSRGKKGEAAGDKKKGARIRESREEGQVGFSKGVYAKLENYRGLFVKQNFPLI